MRREADSDSSPMAMSPRSFQLDGGAWSPLGMSALGFTTSPMADPTKERLKAIELEISRMKAGKQPNDRDALRALEKGWNSGVGTFVASPLSSRSVLSSGGFRPDELALTLNGPASAREVAADASLRLGGGGLVGGYLPSDAKKKRRSGKGAPAATSGEDEDSMAKRDAARRAERIAKERERQERLRRDIEADKKKREASATKIQACWRGKRARNEVSRRREEKLYTKPATQIQSAWRGLQARRELDRLRKEKEAAIRQEQGAIGELLMRLASVGIDDEYVFSEDELAIIRAQFDRVDTDHNGVVSRDEFSTFYNLVADEKLGVEECNALFDELDADGSGELAFDEFVQLYALIQKREAAKRDPDGKQRLADIDQRLRDRAALLARWKAEERERKAKYDAEKAAEIARLRALFGEAKVDEMRRSAAREEFFKRRRDDARKRQEEDDKLIEEARRRKEVQAFLAKAKARAERASKRLAASVIGSNGLDDGDGGAAGAVGGEEEPPYTDEDLSVLRRQFDYFDLDGSGELSVDEFAVFFNSVSVRIVSNAECDELFHQLDANGSGTLSFEQFVKVYDMLQQLEAAKRDPLAGARVKSLSERLSRRVREVAEEKASREKMRSEYAKRLAVIDKVKKEKYDKQSVEETQRVEAARQDLIRRRHEEARRRREENERIVAAAREQSEVDLFLKKAAYRLKHNLQSEPYTADDLAVLRAQFERFDIDGSGELSIDEFSLLFNSIAVVQVSTAECEAIFKELDTQSRGTLSFDMFVHTYDMLQVREAAKRDPLQARRYEQMLVEVRDGAPPPSPPQQQQQQQQSPSAAAGSPASSLLQPKTPASPKARQGAGANPRQSSSRK